MFHWIGRRFFVRVASLFGARYYHPQLRRFLNQDTVLGSITASASLNRFAYANGNPISGIDPFGLMYMDVDPKVGQSTTLPYDAQLDPNFIGQSNQDACGPTAAWNALILLEGDKAITQNNQVLYDQFAAAALQAKGEDDGTIGKQFNAFSAGTPYQATLTSNKDPFDLAETATSGYMPFIGDSRYGSSNHAQVYVPEGGDQDQVISSTSEGAYKWTMSASSVGSGIYRAQGNINNYIIVQIGFK